MHVCPPVTELNGRRRTMILSATMHNDRPEEHFALSHARRSPSFPPDGSPPVSNPSPPHLRVPLSIQTGLDGDERPPRQTNLKVVTVIRINCYKYNFWNFDIGREIRFKVGRSRYCALAIEYLPPTLDCVQKTLLSLQTRSSYRTASELNTFGTGTVLCSTVLYL